MQELQEKIRENIKVSPDTGCWLWQRACSSAGYGALWWGGKMYSTHRLSYTAFNGEIPEGHLVRHTCDTPQCCNPEHLLVGSKQDNANDMIERGRSNHGENHPRAKLTWETVKNIRKEPKMPYRKLALKYGVSAATICHIYNNKTWKEEEHYDNQK